MAGSGGMAYIFWQLFLVYCEACCCERGATVMIYSAEIVSVEIIFDAHFPICYTLVFDSY